MTRKTESEIDFNIINENFPVAGEDNDTQVFRDNFDSIKNNFRLAQEEITDLLDNTARKDEINNFANNTIQEAVFLNTKFAKFDAGNINSASAAYNVDYENGSYQIVRVDARSTPLDITFENFPQNNDRNTAPYGVGELVLELWGDGSSITLNLLGGGNGTEFRKINFPSAGTSNSVPVALTSANTWDTGSPIFIKIWRHTSRFIFMEYIGSETFGEGASSLTSINDIADVLVESPTNGQVLKYNSVTGKWINNTDSTTVANLSDIGNVTITSPTINQVLKFNGSAWINGTDSTTVANLSDIGNVTITSPTINQVLKFNGSVWVNGADSTDVSLEINDLTNVSITGTPTNNQILKYSSATDQWVVGNLSVLNDLSDVTITSIPTDGQILKYNSATAKWVVGNLSILNDLNDVTITSTPTNGQILKYNSATAKWEVGGLSVLNDLNDVVISGTPTDGEVLKFDSLTGRWINAADLAFFTGSQDLPNATAADLSKSVSYFTTGGAETSTLANGTEGLIKTFIAQDVSSGNMVITVSNFGWAGTGTITLSVRGSACTLQYISGKWFCIGNNGAVFG